MTSDNAFGTVAQPDCCIYALAPCVNIQLFTFLNLNTLK